MTARAVGRVVLVVAAVIVLVLLVVTADQAAPVDLPTAPVVTVQGTPPLPPTTDSTTADVVTIRSTR